MTISIHRTEESMTFAEMKTGVPYIVTRGSDDGSFEVGDQITLMKDGSLSNLQADGWLEPAEVAEAIAGMECEADSARIQRRKESLLRQIAALEAESMNGAHDKDIQSLVLSLRQLAAYQHSDVGIAEEAADLILRLAYAPDASQAAAPKTRSWYGTCGALTTDQPIPGVAEDRLTPEEEEFYGAPYLVAESMTEQAARKISELLGLEYCGVLGTGEQA
jgi:hypothetical protein